MLVLSQRSGLAHDRSRLPVQGRSMLCYQSRSGEALWRRNTAGTSTAASSSAVQTQYATTSSTAANLHDDAASGDADANPEAEADS